MNSSGLIVSYPIGLGITGFLLSFCIIVSILSWIAYFYIIFTAKLKTEFLIPGLLANVISSGVTYMAYKFLM